MLTTSISDFRKDIKKYLDDVTENFETLIINRGKDSGVELSSKINETRLDSAIEKLKTNSSFEKELIDL